jgi:Zn finger protein HypA/HybF involved in hydrogenase expression
MPIEIRSTCQKCGEQVTTIVSSAPDDQLRCPLCSNSLFEIRNVPGYLYILSNTEMPGLLKIGLTTRSVPDRVAELNSATGVPTAFTVEAYFESGDPKTHESAIHGLLAQKRVRGREFFRVTREDAIAVARSVTLTEPRGLAKAPDWPAPASWYCGHCSNEFSSASGWCARCGGAAQRLNWGR